MSIDALEASIGTLTTCVFLVSSTYPYCIHTRKFILSGKRVSTSFCGLTLSLSSCLQVFGRRGCHETIERAEEENNHARKHKIIISSLAAFLTQPREQSRYTSDCVLTVRTLAWQSDERSGSRAAEALSQDSCDSICVSWGQCSDLPCLFSLSILKNE